MVLHLAHHLLQHFVKHLACTWFFRLGLLNGVEHLASVAGVLLVGRCCSYWLRHDVKHLVGITRVLLVGRC